MEQATLVRYSVDDPVMPPLGDSVVPMPARPRDTAPRTTYASVELGREELELLAEIATGVTTEVAARHLELSARTLRRRLRNICDQLGVNTPIEAVVWAARRQLI